jgi:hypothetical protein
MTTCTEALLTGIVTCSVCKDVLTVQSDDGEAVYTCTRGGDGKGSAHAVSATARIDAYVTVAVLARLGRPDVLVAIGGKRGREHVAAGGGRARGYALAVLTAFIASADMPAAWETLDLTRKQSVIRLLMSRIELSPPGHETPLRDIVTITWVRGT